MVVILYMMLIFVMVASAFSVSSGFMTPFGIMAMIMAGFLIGYLMAKGGKFNEVSEEKQRVRNE